MGKSYLPNIEPFIAAGIDLKTGIPKRALFGSKANLKEDIKKALRIIDEQDACGRYIWKNLPMNLTSQELERMLYYKGQLCFFYIKDIDKYCILPYALNGTIDLYGRFNHVRPIPFSNGTTENNDTPLSQYLSKMSLKCIYGNEVENEKSPENCCVLIHDYTKQLSQTILPRVTVNEPLLDVMSDCIPFMRTRLELSTGVKGIRVADADQSDAVLVASDRMEDAALRGKAYIPIVGSIDFQDLATDRAGDSSEYMLAMQSLDNFRLGTYGISNGGLFEKKAHELNAENEMSNNVNSLVLQDGLEIRKHFCEVANKLYNLDIQVDVCEQSNPQMISEDEATETIIDDNEGESDYAD